MKDSNKFLDIDKLEIIFNKLENTDGAGQVKIINRLNHAGLTDCLNYFRSGNYSFDHPYNDYETEELREYFFETLQGRT